MNQTRLTNRFAFQQILHWAVIGLMIPILVLMFQSKGLNLAEVGMVMAVWVGSTALLELPFGSVADNVGRKKSYMFSLGLTMLGTLVMLGASNFAMVLLAASLLGAARAVYSGTLDAWFYDAFQAAQGGRSYHSAVAKINIMVTIGLALGSLLGGWLPSYTKLHLDWFQSIYDANLLVILAACVVLYAATHFLIPNELSHNHQSADSNVASNLIHTGKQALGICLNHQVLKRVLQTTLVFGMALSGVENYWQPHMSGLMVNLDFGTQAFGVVSALYFLMAAVASWLSVIALNWFQGSHRMLLLVSRTCAGAILLCMALITHFTGFVIAYLLFFFLFTLGENSAAVLLQDNTPSQYRSTVLSISSLVVTLGGMMASLVLGYLAEHCGIGVSWAIVAVVLMLSSWLFALIPERVATCELESS